MMEYWNDVKEKKRESSYTQHSTIPIFQYSNCERSELTCIISIIVFRSTPFTCLNVIQMYV